MVAVLSFILLGFLLGMRHATDPDHVIAVGTLVSRRSTPWAALVVGGLWGVGHTVTIVTVGGALVLFAVAVPPRLGLTMEMGVALMLIVLGLWNLTGSVERLRGIVPADGTGPRPAYGHGGQVHSHPWRPGTGRYAHRESRTPAPWPDRRLAGLGVRQLLRPLAVGLVHGLAGSAAVALLAATVIQDPWWALAYLMVFGVGTIAGMMLVTLFLGAVLAYASRRSPWIERCLPATSGLLSLCFGLFIAYQIAVVDGLLAAALPQ